jgi:hypothetical protein
MYGYSNVRNWLNDSKFNHLKCVVIRKKMMITRNINISKGVINHELLI